MRERSRGDSCEPERARAKRTHSSLPSTADRTIAGYTPRSAEQTLLHRIVAEQLESFLARVRDTGQPAPRFIEQELRAYLRCGVLAHGFLRCTAMPASSIERFPAGGEARERGGEGERNAEHRAGANEGARCDYTPGSAAETASRTPAITGTPAKPSRRLAWAALLQRVFEVDALRCPDCGAHMRLLAAIEEPEVAQKILECLDLPARAPLLQPAPSSVSLRLETDFADQEQQSWEFDQTLPDEDGTQ